MRMVPSALRSISASGAPSRTARKGAAPTDSAMRERLGISSLGFVIVVQDNNTAPGSSGSSDTLALLHLGRALLQEVLEPRLGLRIGLGDGGDQRLHGVARGRVALGDARQRLHHREICKRRVAGDAGRQLQPLGETL